jgi:hypothetical protein
VRSGVLADLQVLHAPELVSAIFRGGEGSEATNLSASDLSSAKLGLRIGRYAVILGLLPGEANLETVRETLRRYRNQCVVARSYLAANQALDLQLMLVGPRGSERQPEWAALALMVERDDRVARKLAWLRPEDPANDGKGFAEFLKRTFLARPWTHKGKFDPAALDRLNSDETENIGIPRNTAEEWEAIALRGEDPTKMVDALLAAWKRRSLA